jgi:hypothetical protein
MADRSSAQNDVGTIVRGDGASGTDADRGGRSNRISHEGAPGRHARRLAKQAGKPAGMELVAEKELIKTPAAHVEASGNELDAMARRSFGPE